MNKAVLSPEVQEFISVNLQTDVTKLLLKKAVFESVTNKELVEQIVAKQKCKTKLPTWFAANNICFPAKISIEQTSSEQTARYKSRLISGSKMVDVTGGFGVDDFYFAQQFEQVVHCELNQELAEITAHNFAELGVKNASFYHGDGLAFLSQSNQIFDWIYLDPGRRTESKGKVFLLKDCLPNVPANLELLFSKSSNILIKTSPLIDISQGISELEGVKEIHVVAVNNEVKELLWILEKDYLEKVNIIATNLKSHNEEKFQFTLHQETDTEAKNGLPQTYIFEPNSAILKSGGFNQVSVQLGVDKLQKHSHLYTSNQLIEFPGRRFLLKEIISAKGKELKNKLKGVKANVTTRNYPQKVEEIRKTYKIKEGGGIYLFFTTLLDEKRVCLVCEKV